MMGTLKRPTASRCGAGRFLSSTRMIERTNVAVEQQETLVEPRKSAPCALSDSPVPGAPAFYSLKFIGGRSHELSL